MESVFSNKLLTTRRGTIWLGVGAAVLAALVLLVYLSQYRNNLKAAGAPVKVLVAKRLIEKNTPGNLVATQQLFVATDIRRSEVKAGALTDPSALRDMVAVKDIYPAEQMTVADFVPATGLLVNQLAKDKRAISIPADSIRGLVGHIQSGDHVDVYVGMNNSRGAAVISLLLKDVPVMSAPGTAGGGIATGRGKAAFVLKADDQTAPELAYAADYGRLWLVMRPSGANASTTRDAIVTAE